MAMSGSGPQKLLGTRSKERDNFFTLCTLLIDGGTRVLRDVLDHYFSPFDLEKELNNPQVKSSLQAINQRNKKQWEIMYPPSAPCGKSKDFDIIILFKILTTLVFQGGDLKWNVLPAVDDQRPVADFVRIRYYRNQVFAHATEMKICDEEFDEAWNDISQALIRLETAIDPRKGEEWKEAISLYLESSQAECQRYAHQLHEWYCDDSEEGEVPRAPPRYVNRNEVEIRISPDYSTQRSSELKQQTTADKARSTGSHVLRAAAHGHNKGNETAQVSRSNCSLAGGCCIADNPSPNSNSTMTIATTNDSIVTSPVDSSKVPRDFSGYIALMKHITKEYLANNPHPPTREEMRQAIEETFNLVIVDEREGCLAIRVRCLSLEILQALWEDSRGEKKLKEAAEKCLVTEDVKRQFGIEEFGLKVEISEEEYKACRRKLILRALKTFNLGLITQIEKHIDDGRFQDGLDLMKKFNARSPVEVPAVVKSLLQEQQTINLCNKLGQTPLHIAAVKGDAEVARILLLHGADANKTDMFGRTPLHVASWYGHMEFVRVLLDCCPQLNLDYQDKFGKTALNKATEERHIAVIILLERTGANPSFHVPSLRSVSLEGLTKRHNGYNHVHRLCIEGRYREIKRLLLNHSLRADMLDDCRTSREVAEFADMSPLEIVKTFEGKEHRQIVNAMQEVKKRYADMPKLHQAIQKCRSDEVIALLLDMGVSVDATTGNEESALYLASAVGSAKVMEILLSFDADLNGKTKGGTTPLMIASALQNYSSVKLLLKEGANVNAQDSKGDTVLHNTAEKGDTEMLKELLSGANHPNLECANLYGCTPLHLAAQNGHLKTADILLSKGANPNAHTKQCFRERIYMVQGRSKSEDMWIYVLIHKHVLELWKKELKESADVMLSEFGEVLLAGTGERPPKVLRNKIEGMPWVLDNKDETPLILAVRSGNEDIVSLLLNNGANVGTCDAESLTPLHIAAIKGNTATAMLLVKEGADINAVSCGFTPLNLAEFNDNSEVASYLESIASKREERQEPQQRSVESIPLLMPSDEVLQLKERFAETLLLSTAVVSTAVVSTAVAQARINVLVYYCLNTPAALPPVVSQVIPMATA